MMFLPTAARSWCTAAERDRDWPSHGAMAVRRRQALEVLSTAYASPLRLGAGLLAGLLAALGTRLVAEGTNGNILGLQALGAALMLASTALGILVIVAGATITRALGAWYRLGTEVLADGGRHPSGHRIDAASLDLHDHLREQDRRTPRPLSRAYAVRSVLVAVMLAVVIWQVARVLGDMKSATAPWASTGERVAWLGEGWMVLVTSVAVVALASGLLRVRRAQGHRGRRHEEDAAGPTAVVGPPVQPGVATAWPPLGGWQRHEVEVPPLSAPPPPAEPSSLLLTHATGQPVGQGVVLVGRDPRPRQGEEADELLQVDDGEVSRTHARIDVNASGVVLTDRRSTNGTTVLRYGKELACQPGQGEPLQAGDEIRLGRVRLLVAAPTEEVDNTMVRHDAGSKI